MIFPEIGRNYLWISANLLGCSRSEHFPLIQHIEALTDAHDDLHIMLDKQHRRAEFITHAGNKAF